MLHLTDTLTGSKAPFVPLEEGKVQMYVCGPTVYGLTHIGNARPAVFFDVVRRYLEFSGFQVRYISNFTDVDDKIINRAREDGSSAMEVAQTYTVKYQEDMGRLGVRPPDVAPKVTEFIPQIVEFIGKLVANESAYVTDEGEVLFAVRAFKEYGKLSKKNIDEMRTGVRIRPGEKKRDPLDFALWKPQKAEDEPAWDSPWGKGRPGWHIECSVMAVSLLGETFDIHGGGIDLIHPHHENEIAQSEACTGHPFAKTWLHNNMLNINNEKMSKSLGNFFLNREFMDKFTPETLKFLLLSGHYRSPIDFSLSHIRDSQSALHRFYSAAALCQQVAGAAEAPESPPQAGEVDAQNLGSRLRGKLKVSMDDDLNTVKVIAAVFEYVRCINRYLGARKFKPSQAAVKIAEQFEENRQLIAGVLNLFGEPPAKYLDSLRQSVLSSKGIEVGAIDKLIQERLEARKSKNFKRADEIRDELAAQSIALMDGPEGTTWDITFTDQEETPKD